jgi:hypothetical protein
LTPDYTPDARKARIEGMVVLDVVVLEDGTVGDAVPVSKYPKWCAVCGGRTRQEETQHGS